MDAVTTTGAEDEDGKADENVVEDDDGVSEEAVADTVGEDIPEEDAVQIDEDEDDDDVPPPLTRKGGGRRKRGHASSKAQVVVKPPVRKKDDEEVCFICFDGGDLVVCDRRFVNDMEFHSFHIPKYIAMLQLLMVISMSSYSGVVLRLTTLLVLIGMTSSSNRRVVGIVVCGT